VISSIVLAAGYSSRMGQPKALLDWGGEPLLAYQIKQLKEAGVDEVIVVLGHMADDIHRKIGKLPCRVMLNARYQMGRAGSLRIGAKAVSRDADAIIVINVDQPGPPLPPRPHRCPPRGRAAPPTADGHRGPPGHRRRLLRTEMMDATDETGGLHGVLAAHNGDLADAPWTPLPRRLQHPEEFPPPANASACHRQLPLLRKSRATAPTSRWTPLPRRLQHPKNSPRQRFGLPSNSLSLGKGRAPRRRPVDSFCHVDFNTPRIAAARQRFGFADVPSTTETRSHGEFTEMPPCLCLVVQ
jgi:CTP:molybdopterin cytidylyltransferase MocA